MLRPSQSELMNHLNVTSGQANQVTSGYTVVIAAAKRARQLINGAVPLATASNDRAVSIAIQEMVEGKLMVRTLEEDQERQEEIRRYGHLGVMEIDQAAYDESALKPRKTYSSDDDDEGDDDLDARDDAYLVEDEAGNVYDSPSGIDEIEETPPDGLDDEVYELDDADLAAAGLPEEELEPLDDAGLGLGAEEDAEDDYSDGDEEDE